MSPKKVLSPLLSYEINQKENVIATPKMLLIAAQSRTANLAKEAASDRVDPRDVGGPPESQAEPPAGRTWMS